MIYNFSKNLSPYSVFVSKSAATIFVEAKIACLKLLVIYDWLVKEYEMNIFINKFTYKNFVLLRRHYLTLRRSLRIKVRMRWFFDVSKVKESSFFKSDLTDPPSDFWCSSSGKYRFKPFQISFFSGFYNKIKSWVRLFCSLFERMRLKRKKRCLFTLTNL